MPGDGGVHNHVVDLPDIFAHTDYRAWMRAWFEAKQGRPSIRGFAQRAGCSPALVSSVLAGTRDLAPGLAEKFSGIARLEPDQHAYFLELVEFEQAPTRARRHSALERIMATRRFRGAQREVDAAYLLFSRWYIAAIVELTRCEGFREDPDWIASTLRPSITREQAAEGLATVIAGGLLRRTEEGRLEPTEEIWATDREVSRVASALVATIHREMLTLAHSAVERFPREERHLSTVTLAIPAGAIGEVKDAIGRFVEETTGRYAASAPFEQVVQLSVQMMPLSGRTSESGSE